MARYKFMLRSKKLYLLAVSQERVEHIQDIVKKMLKNADGEEKSVSYQTIRKWISEPERVTRIDLPVLASFLIDGLDMTPEQIANMRLGELLDLIEVEE